MTTYLIETLVEVGSDSVNEFGQRGLILRLDGSQSKASGGLLVNDLTETRFALDDAVGDIHLTAKSRQPDNQLDGVDVMGDDNQLSFLGFDQSCHVVETILDNNGFGSRNVFVGLSLGRGSLLKALLLLRFVLRAVLVQKTEDLSGRVLVESLVELVDAWRNLQAALQYLLLSLETNVFRPSHETTKVTLGLDGTTYNPALNGSVIIL